MANIELYDRYMEDLLGGNLHPQQAGMSQLEFEEAIADPSTFMTTINSMSRPQIINIRHFGWLNHDYFGSKFPNSDVFELIDYDEESFETDTIHRLSELAIQTSVLLLEVSSNQDSTLVSRNVLRKLADAGVGSKEPELLGTQTYFAGKAEIKDKREDKQASGFQDTFNTIVLAGEKSIQQNLPYVDKENGVWLEEIIEGEEADRMLGFYEDAYEVLNDHPCKQGLDPETFFHMLKDPSISKAVVRRDGRVETLFIITDKIHELSWVNFEYYKQNYAQELSEKKLIWFPGIATDPEAESMTNGQKIVSTLTRLGSLGNFDPTLVFDFCDKNTGILDRAIEYWMLKSGDAKTKFEVIADQKYFAIELKPTPIQL